MAFENITTAKLIKYTFIVLLTILIFRIILMITIGILFSLINYVTSVNISDIIGNKLTILNI